MAVDLSTLSDEQLDAYKSLLQSKQNGPGHPIVHSPTATLSPPEKSSTGLSGWLGDVADDVRNGTTATLPGRAMHAMGALGTDTGVPRGVGEFMGSPILGPLTAAKGVPEFGSGDFAKGIKDVTGGVTQTAEIPGAFMSTVNPITALRAVAGGNLVGNGARALFSGAGPNMQDAAENVGNIIGGGALANERLMPILKGAANGARELTPHTHLGVRLPKSVVGAGVGGYIGGKVGHPEIGTAIGAAIPALRGAAEGAGDSPFRIPISTPGIYESPSRPMSYGSSVRPGPGDIDPQRPLLTAPQPRPPLMLNRGPLVTAAPADASFVRGVPAEYPTKEPGFIENDSAPVTTKPVISQPDLDVLNQQLRDSLKARGVPVRDTPASVRERANTSRAKFNENGNRNQLKK